MRNPLMDPNYWHERWTEGRTGWHQDQPSPLLLDHWPTLGLADDAKVFVPLAGKSVVGRHQTARAGSGSGAGAAKERG